MAIAVGATFLGFVIDAARGTELTSAFACFYIIGVVAAVALVRYRGLFTALVQAPLILFVAVPLAYQYFTENPGTGLKDILLNVAIPLVNRFPLMLLGTVLALAMGAARVFLKRQASHGPTRSPKRSAAAKPKPTREQETKQDDRGSGRSDRRRAAADSRGGRTRSTEPAARSRRAGREAGPRSRQSETRQERRERNEPRYDRPAADPYRPNRDGLDRARPQRDDVNRARPERERPQRESPQRESQQRESQQREGQQREGQQREGAPEPSRRPAPRPQAPRSPRPPEVDPYSAPRAGAHIPPHPVPQVRYRDRGDG